MTRGYEPRFDGDIVAASIEAGELREGAFARILLGGRELWEHKTDHKFAETGNIAVEYEKSALPNGAGDVWKSGIAVCTAHWLIVEYLPDKRFVWPTDDVKALARRAIKQGLHKWIGDDNRFHNALVPGAWFVEPPEQLRLAA